MTGMVLSHYFKITVPTMKICSMCKDSKNKNKKKRKKEKVL